MEVVVYNPKRMYTMENILDLNRHRLDQHPIRNMMVELEKKVKFFAKMRLIKFD